MGISSNRFEQRCHLADLLLKVVTGGAETFHATRAYLRTLKKSRQKQEKKDKE
jgi:hypothetical protein